MDLVPSQRCGYTQPCHCTCILPVQHMQMTGGTARDGTAMPGARGLAQHETGNANESREARAGMPAHASVAATHSDVPSGWDPLSSMTLARSYIAAQTHRQQRLHAIVMPACPPHPTSRDRRCGQSAPLDRCLHWRHWRPPESQARRPLSPR